MAGSADDGKCTILSGKDQHPVGGWTFWTNFPEYVKKKPSIQPKQQTLGHSGSCTLICLYGWDLNASLCIRSSSKNAPRTTWRWGFSRCQDKCINWWVFCCGYEAAGSPWEIDILKPRVSSGGFENRVNEITRGAIYSGVCYLRSNARATRSNLICIGENCKQACVAFERKETGRW